MTKIPVRSYALGEIEIDALQTMLDYLWDSELESYEDIKNDPDFDPDRHVFTHMQTLKTWLDKNHPELVRPLEIVKF